MTTDLRFWVIQFIVTRLFRSFLYFTSASLCRTYMGPLIIGLFTAAQGM